MKKGVFGAWFRELATLVFTQTIQAFLLAIVMTIVISAMGAAEKDATNNDGKSGTNYAAGMLAIIALSQFGKIELLIKNIFGVTSQYGGGMEHGKGGLIASMAAFKLGKRGLDNLGKVTGGIGGALKANRNLKTLRNQRKNIELEGKADEAENGADLALNEMENTADKFINNTAKGAAMATGAQMVGGTNGNNGGIGISSSDIQKLITAINSSTNTLKSNKSKSDKDDKKEKLAEIDKKINEAKLNRRTGVRQAVSGVSETAGAIVGAAAGATVGLGMGEGVVRNAVTGLGIGDMAGGVGFKVAQTRDNYHTGKKNQKIDIEISKDQIKQTNEKINKANRDKQTYDSVKSTLNKAMERGIMSNASTETRAKAVEKLKNNAKEKYNASNM